MPASPNDYEIVNISLAATIGTRDANFNKDALLNNCYAEDAISEGTNVLTRFGYVATAAVPTILGTACGLFSTAWGTEVFGVLSGPAVTSVLTVYTTANGVAGQPAVTALATVGSGYYLGPYPFAYPVVPLPVDINQLKLNSAVFTADYSVYQPGHGHPIFLGSGVVFVKNTTYAATLSHSTSGVDTWAQVTDLNYPGNNTTAASPQTVPGVAALDGYIFVYSTAGLIWNSVLNTPATWNALNYIVGNPKNDQPVYITNYYDFIMTLNSRSLCFFYDNGNYPGSPLNRNISADQDVGCSTAGSVARSDNTLLFIGSTTDSGNKVYQMNGLVPEVVSNPYIDRIIDDDTLANVTAYILETNGHKFYLLNLPSTNVTLLLDLKNREWHTWSSSTLNTGGAATAAPSLTMGGAYVNFQQNGHGRSTGDFVQVSGYTNSPALVNRVITVVDANNYYYQLGSTETTPTFGATVTVTQWLQNAFNGLLFSSGTFEAASALLGPNAAPYIQDANTGSVFRITDKAGTDNGNPILCQARTEGWDGNTDENKMCSQIDVVGDVVPEQYTCVLSFTDDDFQTYQNFRPVDLSVVRSQLVRNGRFRRRAWFMQYFGQSYLRFYRLQMKIKKGTM